MSRDSFVYPKNLLRLGRSGWKMPTRHKTTFMHGDAVPLQWLEVLPGDEISCDMAELIRMSTPIAPLMDDITCHVAAYWVPMRLVFENWEELCGCNKDGAWTTGMEDVVVPHLDTSAEGAAADMEANQILTYGLPSFTHKSDVPSTDLAPWRYHTLQDYIVGCHDMLPSIPVSVLPYRAYYEVWNNNYRSQVVSAPIPVDKSANNDIIVNEDTWDTLYRAPELLGKFPDLFTKALPQPQKGDAVKFLADLVPVVTGTKRTKEEVLALDQNGIYMSYQATGELAGSQGLGTGATAAVVGTGTNSDNNGQLVFNNLYADLSGALNTINDLRYAFQLQKFLEKDARYGSARYFEYLNAHFGITIADGVAQLPVWLGETNFRINIDQVLSTAGYAASSSTSVGSPGANSVTGHKGNLFKFTAKEHGYIIFIMGCRHTQTYAQGVNRNLLHLSKLDFYHPEFANIGEVPINQCEIQGNSGTYGESFFGYQEAWYEYRYLPSRVTGLLNPANTGSLSFWTLANAPAGDSPFALNEAFIYENRESIARALVTGATGPDYISDWLFTFKMARIMPAYSIPGFADHH